MQGRRHVLRNAMANSGDHIRPNGILYNMMDYDAGKMSHVFHNMVKRRDVTFRGLVSVSRATCSVLGLAVLVSNSLVSASVSCVWSRIQVERDRGLTT